MSITNSRLEWLSNPDYIKSEPGKIAAELLAARALNARVADLMRRCDPDYCESHSVEQTTDDEWDELLGQIEDAAEVA